MFFTFTGGDEQKAVQELKDAITQGKVDGNVQGALDQFARYMKLPGVFTSQFI